MRYFILLLLLLASCVNKNDIVTKDSLTFDFSKKYTFKEYENLLKEYNDNKNYPNIDDKINEK